MARDDKLYKNELEAKLKKVNARLKAARSNDFGNLPSRVNEDNIKQFIEDHIESAKRVRAKLASLGVIKKKASTETKKK